MCVFQERFSEISTPRYFAAGTASRRTPCKYYLFWAGRRDLVMCMTWHLDGLNSMSQAFSQDSRC